jgi:hypothetical protein
MVDSILGGSRSRRPSMVIRAIFVPSFSETTPNRAHPFYFRPMLPQSSMLSPHYRSHRSSWPADHHRFNHQHKGNCHLSSAHPMTHGYARSSRTFPADYRRPNERRLPNSSGAVTLPAKSRTVGSNVPRFQEIQHRQLRRVAAPTIEYRNKWKLIASPA